MTQEQEQKQLLVKDICARLPYGIFANYVSKILFRKPIVGRIYLWSDSCFYIKKTDKYPDNWNYEIATSCEFGTFKPYLRPMSSMTKEEREEFLETCRYSRSELCYLWELESYDWLNAHYFDYRGLIEQGLALPATEDMYKIK